MPKNPLDYTLSRISEANKARPGLETMLTTATRMLLEVTADRDNLAESLELVSGALRKVAQEIADCGKPATASRPAEFFFDRARTEETQC